LVEELSFATVRDRLIAHLLLLGEERGIRTDAGIEVHLQETTKNLPLGLAPCGNSFPAIWVVFTATD
jgi:hypothetical protein